MPWEVMPDLFFYRDPEEAEKEEAARAEEVIDNGLLKLSPFTLGLNSLTHHTQS